MKYRIWERFSEEARRVAAAAVYAPNRSGGFARTEQGCCPLGVALTADTVPVPRRYPSRRWDSPGALSVGDVLGDRIVLGDEARLFISDWDGGKIQPRDLARLLEVGP